MMWRSKPRRGLVSTNFFVEFQVPGVLALPNQHLRSDETFVANSHAYFFEIYI